MRPIVFPACPAIRPADSLNSENWIVEDAYSVQLSSCVLSIRKGLTTDGASIPRAFWRMVGHPFQLPMLPCALAHDALYASELLPRNQCDWEFLCLMQKAGISWIKRNVVYSGVRAGGSFVWAKHTPKTVAEARRFCLLS